MRAATRTTPRRWKRWGRAPWWMPIPRRVLSIWESVVPGSQYGNTDLSGADRPAAKPAGYHQGGF
ncbi:MAG: hypothetical protein ABIJ48_01295 [Actinomycetota bacterium]